LAFLLWPLACANPVWAWFAEGHEFVAVIAADDLTPTARLHVAQILGVPDDTSSVEKAMAALQFDRTPRFAMRTEQVRNGISSIFACRTMRPI
jgi:hypothetical protein